MANQDEKRHALFVLVATCSAISYLFGFIAHAETVRGEEGGLRQEIHWRLRLASVMDTAHWDSPVWIRITGVDICLCRMRSFPTPVCPLCGFQ